MKRGSTFPLERMKLLPSRLRMTHLRALIRLEPSGSVRALELAALLRDELTAAAANENRTALKLENASRPRSPPPRASALPMRNQAAGGADHSHPHSNQNLSPRYPPPEEAGPAASSPVSAGVAQKTAIAVNAELAACVAKRTSAT